MLRALDILVDCPVITATRLRKILIISAPATKTALEQLQAVGILVECTGYARNRQEIWVSLKNSYQSEARKRASLLHARTTELFS